MSKIVKLIINDLATLEYDKAVDLPNNQLQYLEMMDKKMEEGVVLGDEFITKPDNIQKSQFVALNMLALLDKNEEQEAIAMFTYLVNYLSELKQVKVKGTAGKYKIEFVFYKDLNRWESIQFH